MAKTPKNTTGSKKSVEALTHDEAKRKNIPTAEYQSVLQKTEQDPVRVAYKREAARLEEEKTGRNRDLDPQLIWRGKDEQDWSDLVVQAPPLYIQEKVHPKALIDDLLRESREREYETGQLTPDLFADFNGIPKGVDKTEFYQHDQNWSNRMILGDSLQVMASLAEREGLRGKVQCIYLDPPYGIKFNSNFQWSTTSRDVKDGNASHITREPEQVKAFRDTWRDGIHSYLTYLRDRLTVARDLLTDSGSIFVQIGDENVHRIRAVMDEVFGEDNFCSTIQVTKTGSQSGALLSNVADSIVWYSKSKPNIKFRKFFLERPERESREASPDPVLSSGFRTNTSVPFTFREKVYDPGTSYNWKTHLVGMERLAKADRLIPQKTALRYARYFEDYPVKEASNIWADLGGASDLIYVVQTATKVIQRCILMVTDPGDLVLDPTCGSGTAATVAEQWGRRWITIDTSRVALALARARIMGARYPFYLLADSLEGQIKEAEVSHTAPSSQPVHGNIRHGFVYERVPHIQLSDIANNVEIDVIWDKWQTTLEPLRELLNTALKKTPAVRSLGEGGWQEWEIPREADAKWPDAAKKLHADWWQARIARQQEIDKSIAAKAEVEYLYDKPYPDNKKARVAGPFTVESLSPHRVLGVDENDKLIDQLKERSPEYGAKQSFAQMILDNLKTAGVQQAHKEGRITFTTLTPWPGDLVCAEGRYIEGNATTGVEKRAAIFIGPEFGTVTRPDLVAAAREAGDAGFDVLIACAFNYDAHSTEFSKLGRIPVLKARMNADLHMADDLKNTGKGNLFVIFGEPDITVVSGQWLVARNGRMIANYEHVKELSGLGSLEEINRAGRAGLSDIGKVSGGGTVRTNVPSSAGRGVSGGEYRGGSGTGRDAGVPPVPGDRERVTGGDGNISAFGCKAWAGVPARYQSDSRTGGHRWSNAQRTQALSALENLRESDFPLSLTTDHRAQVTVHGVDVFKPQTGEVISDGADGIACWFIDTDYNEESFFVRHAYFLGANDPYSALKTTLKAEINEDAWATLNSDTSRAFDKPKSGRIAVKVINHLGDEVMKVFRV